MKKKGRKSKILLTVLLALVLASFLVSCGTKMPKKKIEVLRHEPTEEEAAYAMETAVSTAVINAGQDLITTVLPSLDFLPDSYLILKDYTDRVAGMNAIMENWRNYFRFYITQSMDGISEKVNAMLMQLEFDNPYEFVRSSNTSGTRYFVSLFGDQIRTEIKNVVEQADFTYLEKGRNQYNVYIRTTNFISSVKKNELEKVNAVTELTNKLYNTFIELVAEEEDLFRTTPDPYGDPVVKAVFGTE